jgi:hypothetical protein
LTAGRVAVDGDSKVDKNETVTVGHEHVARFDVAMDFSSIVEIPERANQLNQEPAKTLRVTPFGKRNRLKKVDGTRPTVLVDTTERRQRERLTAADQIGKRVGTAGRVSPRTKTVVGRRGMGDRLQELFATDELHREVPKVIFDKKLAERNEIFVGQVLATPKFAFEFL